MSSILIITQYFPPETGAASNRISQLANGLQSTGFNTTVLTPLPNYPTGRIFEDYKHHKQPEINEKGAKIYRLWIYPSNSKNKLLRLFSMLSYSLSLIWFFISHKIPNKVIIQSPPLIVAFTAVLFLRKKKRKIILNVSDLWPLAGLELDALKRNFSYKILEQIERFNYRNSDLILGQSEEIIAHIKSISPQTPGILYRNFPDFEAPKLHDQPEKHHKIKLVYAGLLGVAQGILELCRHIDTTNIEFHIYGSGQEAEAIESYIQQQKNSAIFYHGHLSRNDLHKVLIQYDLTIVPLLTRIYGSVPSKIFEFAKLGLPVLYFGGGEGEDLVKKHELGWVAAPGDYKGLNAIINSFDKNLISKERKEKLRIVSEIHFDFKKQLQQLVNVI
ncbi:glycosyltransferase family 4 protein [Paucihalobacter ruber]|uniref:Glycosyltransferase family 4 protein n=1 Tax=Paucihalobacter ruber TaxID=2567861 RepID=A0A506PP10_9FLAO|nr:glycosyltransferase family 4 protein [Paucihalobacter ruber]TPV34965.1 glycosyltransferase family 4 protein [Paucihalobacter ruber]